MMDGNRSFLKLAVAVSTALALLVSACSIGAPAAFTGPIKIGIVGPFSGTGAQAGERVSDAVKMAIDEQNTSGGLLGAKIEPVIGDDEGLPEKSTTVAQKMVDDPLVVGVIGPMSSGPVIAAAPIYDQASLVLITPTATNPKVTEMGLKAVHRLAGRDDREGPAAATFIVQQLKPKRVFLIDDKTAFQAGITQEVQKGLTSQGVSDTTLEEVAAEDKDLTPLLTKIKSVNPDLVYIGLAPGQASLLLKQAQQVGVKLQVMGNGSLQDRDGFIKGSGGLAEGAYVSYNAQDPKLVPDSQDFIKKFQSTYNFSVSSYEPQAYDATHILMNAIKAAGVKDGKIDRAAVLQQVNNQKDYKGVLGVPITFDAKGDIAAAPVNIFQVKDNDFVLVKAMTSQ